MDSIKIRMLVESGFPVKTKNLSSKHVPQVPKVNENICYMGRDYKVTKVFWDLETPEVEACLILVEQAPYTDK